MHIHNQSLKLRLDIGQYPTNCLSKNEFVFVGHNIRAMSKTGIIMYGYACACAIGSMRIY